jgi:hypothetical protein
MNKKITIFLLAILIIVFSLSIFQYIELFHSEFVSATGVKPSNGHFWSEMECDSSGLCVDGSGLGIGTSSIGSNKLKVVGNVEVEGSINVSTNVCLSSGACLSDMEEFVGAQPISGGTDHTRAMCITAGGELVDVGLANPVCRFASSSCPSGWYQFHSWSTTTASTVSGSSGEFGSCSGCTTGYHGWSDVARESCGYTYYAGAVVCADAHGCCSSSISANISQIGCY